VQQEVAITKDLRMDLVVCTPEGKELWIDLTVFGVDALSNSKKTLEQLDDAAETKKIKHYKHEADAQDAEFMALPMTVHGGFGQSAARVFAKLAAIASCEAIELVRAASYAIQIGNGQIMRNSRAFKRGRFLAAARKQRKQPQDSPPNTPAPSEPSRSTSQEPQERQYEDAEESDEQQT
jgi:hypothetical protein